MNMKIKNISLYGLCGLLICLTFLTILSCHKDEDMDNNSIIGRWQWFKTIDSWPYKVRTPFTEGYTAILKFDEEDHAQYFRNDSIQWTYPYKLKYRINDILNPGSDSTLVLVIDNGTPTFFSIEHDTLMTDQSYVDGPRKYYERIK
ncbi:MAG: hypothetical protein ABJB16_19210 [Saprospiraceae bacterium]